MRGPRCEPKRFAHSGNCWGNGGYPVEAIHHHETGETPTFGTQHGIKNEQAEPAKEVIEHEEANGAGAVG